jgi:hypothetical protein
VEAARLPSTTPRSLRTFLYTTRADMPNIQLPLVYADDLIAFLVSLETNSGVARVSP